MYELRITCDDCNSSVLLSFAANPIEAQELIDDIRRDIKN